MRIFTDFKWCFSPCDSVCSECISHTEARDGVKCLHMCAVTFEQSVHAYVAEGQANDGGLVQVSSDGGLQRQEARQIPKHIRLHSPSPSSSLTADRSSESRSQEMQRRLN